MEMTMKKSIGKAILGMVILLVLDQLTKIWAYNTLRLNGSMPLIKDVFALTYLENRGAAWGMLEGGKLIFILIAALITCAAVYVYIKTPMEKKYVPLRMVLVFLVSGAIGNVIDRFTRGFVVDFFSFELIHFPIFNVADIYITCSAAVLILLIFFYYKDEDFAFLEKKK